MRGHLSKEYAMLIGLGLGDANPKNQTNMERRKQSTPYEIASEQSALPTKHQPLSLSFNYPLHPPI